MRKFIHTFVRAGAIVSVFAVLQPVFGVSAQTQFPSQPIRIIVGFSPGGGFDTTARTIARAAKKNGITMVVENRKGAGGRRAVSYTARSKPDGYTLVFANLPMQLFYNILGKDSFKLDQFSWIAQAVTQDGIVVVKADSSIKSVTDLKSLDRFRLCMGGMAGHDGLTAMAMGKALAYKPPQLVLGYRSSRAVPGLIKGECDVAVGVSNPIWAGAVKAKKLRVLAVFAPKRSVAFPDAPTFKSLGYAELSDPSLVMHGFIAGPRGIPKKRVSVLEKIVVNAMNDPETGAALISKGVTPAPLSSKQVTKMIGDMKGLIKKYGPLVAPHVR